MESLMNNFHQRSFRSFDKFIGLVYNYLLREERRLRVFENRVLRRIFGPKRDEETGG
jgi:hypothetical protein